MATRKRLTAQIVDKDLRSNWYPILKGRAQALASDEDHTFTYRDRNAITKATTRQQIVDIYETAYSELAESFHGHLDRIDELESMNRNFVVSQEKDRNHILHVNNRAAKMERRIEGLLTIIEAKPND